MPDIVLRRSGFVHLVDLGPARVLAVHAITQMRLTVTHPVAQLIRFFDQPHPLEIALPRLASELGIGYRNDPVVCDHAARPRHPDRSQP